MIKVQVKMLPLKQTVLEMALGSSSQYNSSIRAQYSITTLQRRPYQKRHSSPDNQFNTIFFLLPSFFPLF